MYSQKFVLSIIHDGHPVKESGSNSNRQVAIPFESEYKIRLKNKNDRSCTARITIDGTPVSSFGDIIINSGSTVDLERFITNSMNSGKKFKFVSLDHPNVDDPTKSENGIVRVEFRLAKTSNGIKILPPQDNKTQPKPWSPDDWPYDPYPPIRWGNDWIYYTNNTRTINDTNSNPVSYTCSNFVSTTPIATKCRSNNMTAPGATIEGDRSNQSFTYSSLDVESFPSAVLTLKMVGIQKSVLHVTSKYCTNCGVEARKNDKFCGNCGKRI